MVYDHQLFLYSFILSVNTVTVFTREKQAPPYHCYIHLGYKGHVCYISVNYNNPKDQNPQRCPSLRNATSSSFVFCHPGKSTLLIDRHRLNNTEEKLLSCNKIWDWGVGDRAGIILPGEEKAVGYTIAF